MSFRQKELADWQTKNFGRPELWQMVMGMNEEAGEAAHAMLKLSQGIRMTEEEAKIKLADAICDTIVYGVQALSLMGIDAQTEYDMTVAHVLSRDWKADKLKGITATEHKG